MRFIAAAVLNGTFPHTLFEISAAVSNYADQFEEVSYLKANLFICAPIDRFSPLMYDI